MSQLGKLLLIGAVLSLISFVIFLALLQAWVPFHWVALTFMIVFTASALWLDRKFYSEFFSMKTTKQGLSMGTLIVIVVGILSAVNFVGARRYATLDLTAGKVNSLSDQSIKLVESLKEELKVIYFYKTGTEGVEQNRKQFVDLIRKYQDYTSKIQLEFVDVNTRPDLTEKYAIKQDSQAVLMEYQGRTNLVEKIDEQELTSSIVKVSREIAKKVFVVTGHGELSMDASPGGDSASFLKSLLEGNRYEVKAFNFSEGAIPADADVVMILGPKQQYLEGEVRALESYLANGGSLILALEPGMNTGLNALLERVGIKTLNNFVLTTIKLPVGEVTEPRFTRGSVFSPSNPITRPFGQGQFTVFRFPQVLERIGTNPPEGLQIDDLVRTDASSFSVTNLDSKEKQATGPFSLAMAVKGKFPGAAADAKEFNMVVLGDRDILNDQSLYQNLNRDLLLNSVALLAKEENIISITPKETQRTEMVLLDTSFVIYIFLFAIPLPLALYLSSFVMWWRRRSA